MPGFRFQPFPKCRLTERERICQEIVSENRGAIPFKKGTSVKAPAAFVSDFVVRASGNVRRKGRKEG